MKLYEIIYRCFDRYCTDYIIAESKEKAAEIWQNKVITRCPESILKIQEYYTVRR